MTAVQFVIVWPPWFLAMALVASVVGFFNGVFWASDRYMSRETAASTKRLCIFALSVAAVCWAVCLGIAIGRSLPAPNPPAPPALLEKP